MTSRRRSYNLASGAKMLMLKSSLLTEKIFVYYRRMTKVAIIGFGRFGELLANLSKDAFDVHVIESDSARQSVAKNAGFKLLTFEAVAEADIIFLAVPISHFGDTVKELATFVDERHTIVDLCSVKVYPAQLMQKHFTKSALLATHPMFGPDSAKNGLNGLQVAFCPLRIEADQIQIIKAFWEGHGAVVTESTPEQHDKDSVYSQAFTYSLARIILNMHLPSVGFRTRSFDKLTEIAELSANDSEQLFHDMLFYNPYFSGMKEELEAAIKATEQKLAEIENEQAGAKLFEND